MQREIEKAIAEAHWPDGRPQFYPPLQHPAHYQQRVMLEKLRKLDDRTVPRPLGRPGDIDHAIEHCERAIAIVEVGQQRELQAFVEATRQRLSRQG